MGLLTPFALLGLALLAPVIAMYLLKRRRDEVPVSSLYLWEQVVQDMEANAPWQRLRRNLLLLLQLLVLLALIFALARPFTTRAGSAGRSVIAVLDSSLSMAAQDSTEGTRLDAARAELRRLLDGLPADGTLTVIRAGDGAEILLANTRDSIALGQALDRVQATATDSDLSQALTLAAAAAEREAESEVVVLSDGAVTLPESLALSRPLRYVPLGDSRNNQAISALQVERNEAGTQLFVQLVNYNDAEANRRLVIEVDGTPFSAADLLLPPDGQAISRLFPISAEGDFAVEARLEGEDVLPADDRAWAVADPTSQQRVEIISPSASNRYLRLPFELVGAEVTQSPVPSDTLRTEADLLVLDRWLPSQGLPGGDANLLLIAPPIGNDTIRATGTITNPVPIKTGRLPLIEENLFFADDLFFVEAQATDAPPWATVLLEDANRGTPLLWVGEEGGRRVAMLATPLYGQPQSIPLDPPRDVVLTNLVYQPSYPVLMATLADYLLVGPAGGLAGRSLTVGDAVTLPLLDSASVELTLPDGTVETLAASDGQATTRAVLNDAGVYAVRWLGSDQPALRFTANRIVPSESNIAPAPTLALTTTAGNDAASALPLEGRQELWRPLLLVGLLLLMAEWLLYNRDAFQRRTHNAERTTKTQSG
ncbi:MAG: VWA domain-containing protein [Anaerolineales bacterium]|nr:VWA domain-containing protein [Anaerolineales bacterium]MCB9129286.1 VWA domain-containing protein [Ardenticatenales bacterium]